MAFAAASREPRAAVIAMALAAVGIYRTVVYSIWQRRKEMGVKLALGSTPGRLAGGEIGRLMVPVVSGICVGLGGTIVIADLLGAFVFGISATHLPTLLATGASLGAVGVIAGWIPARRIGRSDPAEALRG